MKRAIAIRDQGRPRSPLRAAEFFAGIGLARLGLERSGVSVAWANDSASSKRDLYEKNFGGSEDHIFVLGDLGEVQVTDIPAPLDLAWASFPCTDLSQAGGRAGLHRGAASSTFWHFIKLLSKMGPDRPPVVAIENVTALATSHNGRDIASVVRALNGLGYSVDVLRIDALHFVPQSRPRLFIIGSQIQPVESGSDPVLRPRLLDGVFSDPTLVTHQMMLPPLPEKLSDGLAEHLEDIPSDDPRWWDESRILNYESSLTYEQADRYQTLRKKDSISYRTAYRRMRSGIPRWEMRRDGVAGCLRTSRGGSSKQAVVVLGEGSARIRWMTPREYASLMGAPDFPLDQVYEHHAYSGFGDAVCAPAVTWLSDNYLVPLLRSPKSRQDECLVEAI